MSLKRQNTLTWDEYFMGLAHLSALRSKDPNTQVGACIVDENHRVVSVGYNGFPKGCSDDVFPWGREGGVLDTKYAFVVHAELNAILNSPRSVAGCSSAQTGRLRRSATGAAFRPASSIIGRRPSSRTSKVSDRAGMSPGSGSGRAASWPCCRCRRRWGRPPADAGVWSGRCPMPTWSRRARPR